MTTRQATWRPASTALGRRRTNVGQTERFMSAVAGAALVTAAIRRGMQGSRGSSGAYDDGGHAGSNRSAWILGGLGAALLYRATTGQCPAYSAAGINTAEDSDTRRALSGPRGTHAEAEITIARPVGEVFAFWRRLDNLPRVMSHLQSVTVLDDRNSRWVAKGPMGTTVEWEAEINNEVPDKVIGWRSRVGSEVVSAGSVNFDPLPDGQGTGVRVKLQYDPPAGRVGAWVARLLGEEPSIQIREDLQRFKQLMETGEIPGANP